MANRKVLLIVDLQQGFIKKGMEKVPANIRALLAHEKFDLVIQSRWENQMDSRYERDLAYTRVGNTAETALLLPDYSDHIISRCQYSCVTDYFSKLVDTADTVYVAGVDTDACVLATLFDLWDAGYVFHVYKDCVGTSAKGLQLPTLQLITRNFGRGCLL